MAVCLESLRFQEYLINSQILEELVDKLRSSLRMNWGIHIKLLQKIVSSIKDGNLLTFDTCSYQRIEKKRQKPFFTIRAAQ